MARRVAITGLGTTNPLGGDVTSTWAAALAGTPGVHALDEDWQERYDLPVGFAARLAVPAATVLPVRDVKRMDPSSQYAVIAAEQAWADAGSPGVDRERLGAVFSSGIGGLSTTLSAWDTVRERGARRALPFTVPMLMPNAPAANVSVRLGAQAGAHAPVSACASGAEAIALGASMIRSGRADVVVCGGTEAAIHPLTLATFAKMQALSTRNESPETASRPYDTTRDGFVMGEGAGAVVLESAEFAAGRGARVLGYLSGVGLTADAYDVAPPDPSGSGQERAMRLALADAGLSGRDVAYVNAHATSTPAGDMVEAHAIARATHPGVLVSATKSMTGHLLGGAGAVETIFTVLALGSRSAPPTINVTSPEPDLPFQLVRDQAASLPDGDIAVVNNAFGFGGHNVALVFTSR